MSDRSLFNQDEASLFVDNIQDREIRNAVRMALSVASVMVLPHKNLDGRPVAPLTPAQPIDLLFLANVFADVFNRKQAIVDILCGRRNPEDELL